MGQKIHPTGFRIATIEPWRSRWYATKKDFKRLLLEDKKIRDHINSEFGSAGIPRIEIERTGEAVNVIIYTARPGVLVGRKGVRVDQLKQSLQKITGMTVHLTLHEIKRPELEAKLVAEVVAEARGAKEAATVALLVDAAMLGLAAERLAGTPDAEIAAAYDLLVQMLDAR
jgi:small subunit ribosomal protein S3